MFDSYYGERIYDVLLDIYNLLVSLSTDIDNILYSIIFFGFLFTAFNFISKRWLTLNG